MLFSLRSLPNLLGLIRIVATPLLVWLILLGSPAGYIWAVVLLILMALSDMADGKIARRLNVVSPLGVFLDTISDKIFVAGALLPMLQVGLVDSWVVFVIIVREFVISGLRSFAAAEGQVIAAGAFGKQKLVIQVVALVWRLLAAAAALASWPAGELGAAVRFLLDLWPLAIGLAVIWTLGSGLEYIWRAWPLLRRSWEPHEMKSER